MLLQIAELILAYPQTLFAFSEEQLSQWRSTFNSRFSTSLDLTIAFL